MVRVLLFCVCVFCVFVRSIHIRCSSGESKWMVPDCWYSRPMPKRRWFLVEWWRMYTTLSGAGLVQECARYLARYWAHLRIVMRNRNAMRCDCWYHSISRWYSKYIIIYYYGYLLVKSLNHFGWSRHPNFLCLLQIAISKCLWVLDFAASVVCGREAQR